MNWSNSPITAHSNRHTTNLPVCIKIDMSPQVTSMGKFESLPFNLGDLLSFLYHFSLLSPFLNVLTPAEIRNPVRGCIMAEHAFLSLLWIPSATLPTRTGIASQSQHKTRSTCSTNSPSIPGPSLLFLKLSFSRCSPHCVSGINIFVLLKHTGFHFSCANATSL